MSRFGRQCGHLLPCLLGCLLLTGCGSKEGGNSSPPRSPETIHQEAPAEQKFALELYARMAEEAEGENLFFSPHSVYSVLAMAAEGADGETAEQMANVLGLEKSDGSNQFVSTHNGLASLADGLQGQGKNQDLHTFLTANAVWVDKSFPLAPAYQQALESYFNGGGGVFPCDFHNRYAAEAARIDQWCADNTQGRITSIMPDRTPEEAKLLKLVLTNAAYFEGKWVTPFEPKDTKQWEFQLGDGSKIRVNTMTTWGFDKGRYGAVDADGHWFTTPREYDPNKPTDEQNLYPAAKGFTMAELPYKGDRVSMLVIVPREADGLSHVEKLLTAERLAGWVAKMEARYISRVRLPKFNLATSCDLTPTLADLGMELAFTPPMDGEGADFSRMIGSSDPDLQVYLSMVLHKATLEVDEQGTIAAAVTAGVVKPTPLLPESMPFHPEFLADRPFLMLIRDRQTGDILFMGRINDPR